MAKKYLILSLLVGILGSCAQFEVDTSRTNPFDVVYDSGDFRIVLNKPVRNDAGQVKLEWSNVYHKEADLDKDNFNLVGTSVFSYNGIPGDTAVANIKNKLADGLSPKTTLGSVVRNDSDEFTGSLIIGSFPSVVTTYFISGNYVYTKEDGSSESGIIYSNLVVYDPANP